MSSSFEASHFPTKYILTIEVLSSLFIGTGQQLQVAQDFYPSDGYTWVFDKEAVFNALLSDAGMYDDSLLTASTFELLTDALGISPDTWGNEENWTYFHYAVPGVSPDEWVEEYIKDVYSHPYLPGSSVKGALRTILLWLAYKESQTYPDISDQKLNPDARFAATPLENDIFSPGTNQKRDAPNYSLMRALRIFDSDPLPTDVLQLEHVRVFPQSQSVQDIDIWLEAVKPGTVFQLPLSIENYGFNSDKANDRLRWTNSLIQLSQDYIRRAGQASSQTRTGFEGFYHLDTLDIEPVVAFYRELLTWVQGKSTLADNEWLMQMGWGTGWDAHTLSSLIRDQGEQQMERLVNKYNMMGKGKQFRKGQPFPKTRKLMMRNGEPVLPLGWVKCRLDPIT